MRFTAFKTDLCTASELFFIVASEHSRYFYITLILHDYHITTQLQMISPLLTSRSKWFAIVAQLSK